MLMYDLPLALNTLKHRRPGTFDRVLHPVRRDMWQGPTTGQHGSVLSEPLDMDFLPMPPRAPHVLTSRLPEPGNTRPHRIRRYNDVAAAGRHDLGTAGIQVVHTRQRLRASEVVGFFYERREGIGQSRDRRVRILSATTAADEEGARREKAKPASRE